MIYRLLLFILFIFVSNIVSGQALNEAAARAELEKRGYNAERFEQEMLKKGVNPKAIDINNPVEVARAKKAAEEVKVSKTKKTKEEKPEKKAKEPKAKKETKTKKESKK